MAKRLALVWALFLLVAFAAFAGDIAQFVNLGFSPDSKYFMFGQYGVLEKGNTPWADSYIVDVAANAFAPKGVKQFYASAAIEPGASALGALLNALTESLPQTKLYRIAHLVPGRLLYVLVDGAQPADTLEFRDFQSGRKYTVALTQNASTKETAVSSSFHLDVTILEKDGKSRSMVVGDPGFKRAGVKSYHVKQIILAPDGNSLVFIVAKDEQDSHGSNIRYMVETARVK
jgi:predicted secreted protein